MEEVSPPNLLLFPSVLFSNGFIIDLYSLLPYDTLSICLPSYESFDDNFSLPYQSFR